ncbi:expressed unknown protein [Seminavis robusta]|uniref:Uncharacterized protein n=1 Tax=Seminavis robusta TaxID=568900 RepID=A0A9N8EU89_9STRA|nr:expressed unknown protein [Seminavis robusta]|eukprot:Sro1778_g296970.1 n/a (132) ;mRNA; f:7603-7998
MPSTATTRRVHFAASPVSAVFTVPRKTESEALTLFYQPEDCDRFRAEAQLEKLALELSVDYQHSANSHVAAPASSNVESLNALTQVARHQFKALPVAFASPSSCPIMPNSTRRSSSSSRTSGNARGTARIA